MSKSKDYEILVLDGDTQGGIYIDIHESTSNFSVNRRYGFDLSKDEGFDLFIQIAVKFGYNVIKNEKGEVEISK